MLLCKGSNPDFIIPYNDFDDAKRATSYKTGITRTTQPLSHMYLLILNKKWHENLREDPNFCGLHVPYTYDLFNSRKLT